MRKLITDKWSGDLTISFHKGNLANKFRRTETDYFHKE